MPDWILCFNIDLGENTVYTKAGWLGESADSPAG